MYRYKDVLKVFNEMRDLVEIRCWVNDRLARHVIAIIRISTPE
jgi:hypothetical protein